MAKMLVAKAKFTILNKNNCLNNKYSKRLHEFRYTQQ